MWEQLVSVELFRSLPEAFRVEMAGRGSGTLPEALPEASGRLVAPQVIPVEIPQAEVVPKRLRVLSTAYTLDEESCGRWADGRTSTNYVVRWHDRIVAVDPAIIPIGSWVSVPGYGLAKAVDTGTAIRGHRIDVLMTVWKNGLSPVKRALEWGERWVEVEVFLK